MRTPTRIPRPLPVSIPSLLALGVFACVSLSASMGMGALFPSRAAAQSVLREPVVETRFTRPVCAPRRYAAPVRTNEGGTSEGPRAGYCSDSDTTASLERAGGPWEKLRSWLRDPTTREIAAASLSFSSPAVGAELCEAAARGVKVRLYLDLGTDRSQAETLEACVRERGVQGNVAIGFRGEKAPSGGGAGNDDALSRLQHNKVVFINPGAREGVSRIAFGSANLSSYGLSLHHENWNFAEVDARSHFAGAHRCLLEALDTHADTSRAYVAFLRECRAAIPVPRDPRLREFFVPGDGSVALKEIENRLSDASVVRFTSRHVSLGSVVKGLLAAHARGADVQVLADDNVHWGLSDPEGAGSAADESGLVAPFRRLLDAGIDVRFIETNATARQLAHDKFLLSEGSSADARVGGRSVFTGAGNFTSGGFFRNFENLYLISLPGAVDAYEAHWERHRDVLARSPGQMPARYVAP